MEEYLSNIAEDQLDLENLQKINKLEIKCEKYRQENSDLKKQNLSQKHRIQDLEIEIDHSQETIKNQLGLIKFYKQYRMEQEQKNDQDKLREMEGKIKSLEESMSIKDKKIQDLYQELKEQKYLNDKLVDVITTKEEMIKKLEKGQNLDDDNQDTTTARLEEEIDNLKQRISDLENEKKNIIDKYDDKVKDLNQENNKYQDKIYDLENEILNLKEINKKFEIEEIKQRGGPDTDSEVEKAYKEEIENLKSALNEVKESKKQIKEKAQEQRDSDVKEILDLEKTVEDLKTELNELKKEKLVVENEKKSKENMNEKLLKRNKELEGILGEHGDNEDIINNYKLQLDKKNKEIENLNAKCKEFKENLDLYDQEKETKLKEFQHEKEVLKSELEDKSKKLEVALRELNELRTSGGQGEANIDKLMQDPKQKLYDEIDKCKKELEEKTKEIVDLKNKLANSEIDTRNELEAQTEYLNNIIEEDKRNLEKMKTQKEQEAKDFNEQIAQLEVEIGNYKCELATTQFEMDKKIVTYNKYVKKLQTKLESLGYKFKGKNYNVGRMSVDFARSKTFGSFGFGSGFGSGSGSGSGSSSSFGSGLV